MDDSTPEQSPTVPVRKRKRLDPVRYRKIAFVTTKQFYNILYLKNDIFRWKCVSNYTIQFVA